MTTSAYSDAPPYPVNLQLGGKPVLVVGGGAVAFRKVAGLLAAGAHVTVIARSVLGQLRELEASAMPCGSLRTIERPYSSGDMGQFVLVMTCTNDSVVNAQVHADGVSAGVWVNSADDPANCDFTLPSIVRRGSLQITVSTEGRSPALSMWLRKKFEHDFDESWPILLDVLAEVRAELRDSVGTSEVSGWMEALDDDLHEHVAAGRLDDARLLLRSHLGLAPQPSLPKRFVGVS